LTALQNFQRPHPGGHNPFQFDGEPMAHEHPKRTRGEVSFLEATVHFAR
jgi:hypothetical protein